MLGVILLRLSLAVVISISCAAADGQLTEAQKKARDEAVAAGKSPEEIDRAVEEAGNKVNRLVKEAGQPFRIVFDNGKVIGFKIKEVFSPLHTSIVLAENSCTKAIGTKGDFIVPMVTRSLIPYWVSHPTKQNQPVLSYDDDDKKEKVKSTSAFYTRVMEKDFDQTISRVPKENVEDHAVLTLAKSLNDSFAWFQCPGSCAGILPGNSEALSWDENFETSNAQARMAQDQEEPSFNQITSRLQQVRMMSREGLITFGIPKKTFGALGQFLPPGITYQLQWSFLARNLIEPDDERCEMKWDLDFTRVFTQFTKASQAVEEVEQVSLDLPEYLFSEVEERNQSLSNVFDKGTFESSSVRK